MEGEPSERKIKYYHGNVYIKCRLWDVIFLCVSGKWEKERDRDRIHENWKRYRGGS
jgi:hypothetical protein